jgi:ribosomal protein S18 acetylase RimI-like enzyme
MTETKVDRAYRRRRSAFHESGHGLVRWLVTGKAPELLSIRPGQTYRAITIPGNGTGWEGDFDPGIASIAQPDGIRRWLETGIVIALAGKIAADMAGYREIGYVAPTEDEIAAGTATAALAALSPRHRELLDENEARTEAVPTDEVNAFDRSFALTGRDDEAIAHGGWMHATTMNLLVDHADSLRRLAEALVVTEVMDAETFVSIAQSGRCSCHFWPSAPHERTRAMSAPSKKTPKPAAVYIACRLGEFSAVALWLPPRVEADGDAIVAVLTETVRLEQLGDVFSVLGQMNDAHPAFPHWYLPWFGVDSVVQGQGLGGELLKHCLRIVDGDHLPAYLESPNPRNLSFYERHGFEVTGEARAGDCPPIAFMLRSAR